MLTGLKPTDRVEAVKAFTSFYTGIVGPAHGGRRGSAFSATEARLLVELGQGEKADAARLRRRLGIDPGYMSRVLARLEARGLVGRERSRLDGRRQVLRLTAEGRRAARDLDARAAQKAARLLAKVPDHKQEGLVSAMAAVREALAPTRPTARTVVLRSPRPGDFGWVIGRHGAICAAEHGWDGRFEALVARAVAGYLAARDASREAAWIAELGGQPVGSAFCVRRSDAEARIRLLLVEPSARGLGIGARLVDQCVSFARNAAYGKVALWTNDVPESARRIYVAAGFELVREEPRRGFGQGGVAQYWSLELGSASADEPMS